MPGNHGTVEDRPCQPLTLQTSRHERALRGMEATDGTTSDGEEEAWEYGVIADERLGAQNRLRLVEIGGLHVTPQFRNCRPLDD